MEDAHMTSPPSSFRTTSHAAIPASAPAPAPAQPSHGQQHQSGETKHQTKSKRIVNDGYIYHPYKDYSHQGIQSDDSTLDMDSEDPLPSKDGSHASATRILELRGLERRIVQLLETAGQAIQILSGDAEGEDNDNEEAGKRLLAASSSSQEARQAMAKDYADDRAQKFEALATGYATLVNEIQSGLRRQFHYLTKAGISSSQVPFKNVVYGEEKELETWLNAVDVLKESANGLIDKAERELLTPERRNASTKSVDTEAPPPLSTGP
ncbi:hypothetical protein B0O80DRAFT_500317 [Mortierella sp. GBAus27b]|nr:hypothetical protein BGX31_006585 [Mortierella sp. GBA43]KAI8350973.1 hypothetical protein B0O80DRAFT_500317 [Mortierella sp. GBAus27b]